MVAIPLFDARNFDPATGRADVLPDGWVTRIITGSDMKPTKDQSGKFIELSCKVVASDNTASVGKTFIERLNVINHNDQAVQIAERSLSAICHVCGVFQVSDTAQLHNIPHRVKLVQTFTKDKTPPEPNGNNVVEYADANGNPPARSGASQPASQATQTPQYQPPQQSPAVSPQQAAPASPAAAWGTPQQAAAPAAPAAWGAPQQAAPAVAPAVAPAAPAAAWGAPQQPAPGAWGTPR